MASNNNIVPSAAEMALGVNTQNVGAGDVLGAEAAAAAAASTGVIFAPGGGIIFSGGFQAVSTIPPTTGIVPPAMATIPPTVPAPGFGSFAGQQMNAFGSLPAAQMPQFGNFSGAPVSAYGSTPSLSVSCKFEFK